MCFGLKNTPSITEKKRSETQLQYYKTYIYAYACLLDEMSDALNSDESETRAFPICGMNKICYF
jgi:predicted transcriptional regulator with HTH domain